MMHSDFMLILWELHHVKCAVRPVAANGDIRGENVDVGIERGRRDRLRPAEKYVIDEDEENENLNAGQDYQPEVFNANRVDVGEPIRPVNRALLKNRLDLFVYFYFKAFILAHG